MDFFNPACQSGPFEQLTFGLCDDENTTRAYVDTGTPQKWVATVENPGQRAVTFTAIDKCVINDDEEQGRLRCDGMLTTDSLLYLVELKNQRAHWQPRAVAQLESTIKLLYEHHAAEIARFRTKKAFACNKRIRGFQTVDHELQRRFFQTYGFRIDVQAVVSISLDPR